MRFCPLRLFVPNKAAGLRIFRAEGVCSLRNGLPWQSKRLEQAPALRKRDFVRKRFYPLWLFVPNKADGLRTFRTEGACSLRNGLPWQRKRLEQAPALRKRVFVRKRFYPLRLFVSNKTAGASPSPTEEGLRALLINVERLSIILVDDYYYTH